MNEKKNQKIELGRYLPEDDDVEKLRDEIPKEDDSMEEVNANGKRASDIRGPTERKLLLRSQNFHKRKDQRICICFKNQINQRKVKKEQD